MRQNHISKKINPLSPFTQDDFFRVKLELKLFQKKIPYLWNESVQFLTIFIDKDKIVAISDVIFRLEDVFRKLIKLVHVYIREKLARDISEGQSFARTFFKTENNRLDEFQRASIGDFPANETQKNFLID